MVFTANQEQNEHYTCMEMLLQPEKIYFILSINKEVEAHESISNWKLMKNSEVNNNHKNKYGKLNYILSIWSFKRKRFQYGRLMRHKSILYAHGGIQQRGVNY